MLPALRRGARGTRRRRTADTPPTRRLATPSFQLGRLNHVAVAVPDLAAATATWAALGATVSPPQAMPAHGVTACFVGEQLELLEPHAPPWRRLKLGRRPGDYNFALPFEHVRKHDLRNRLDTV